VGRVHRRCDAARYVAAIESAGLHVRRVEDNPAYKFISKNAEGATRKYGVKSVSSLAVKE
jgi:hypothetical protein